jgi:hypothetical protein
MYKIRLTVFVRVLYKFNELRFCPVVGTLSPFLVKLAKIPELNGLLISQIHVGMLHLKLAS